MNKEAITEIIADFFDIHCEDCYIRCIIDMEAIRGLAESIVKELEGEGK